MKAIKNFFASKINLAAIIMILVSLQDQIMNMDFSTMGKKEIITFVFGLVIMILRTFFTSAASALNNPAKKN